jgi:hypothetical protein
MLADFSIFERGDLHTRTQIAQIERLRINKDENVILFKGFIGGIDGRQFTEFNTAMSLAVSYYAKQNITIACHMYHNDQIKNILRWGPTELIDNILEGDVAIIATHLTEGNIAKTASWNVPNILANLERLRYQLGNTMDIRNQCPVLRQGKKEIYSKLPDYCLPTFIYDLHPEEFYGVDTDTERKLYL